MKVLITGSNGFIARTLIRKLLEKGYGVYGLDLVQTSKELFAPYQNNFLSIIGDITDSHNMEVMFDVLESELGVKFDFCFHLAAMANVDEVREQREKAFDVNLKGTFNIIEACRKRDVPLAFASTACVYGHVIRPSVESGPTNPVDWYGVTKRAGEELVKGLLKHWLILRFGTTYGDEMRPALCTHIFLTQAINNQPYTIKGNGKQTRNFIYVEDLVDGCVRAMEWLLGGGRSTIFNLCGQEPTSIEQLAQTCDYIVHRQVRGLKVKYLPERPDDVFKEDIDSTRAEILLNWTPKHNIEEGLRKTYEKWVERRYNVA